MEKTLGFLCLLLLPGWLGSSGQEYARHTLQHTTLGVSAQNMRIDKRYATRNQVQQNTSFLSPVRAVAFSMSNSAQNVMPVATAPDGTEIWGSVLAARSWVNSGSKYGMYAFDAVPNTELDTLCLSNDLVPNGGSVYADGMYRFFTYVQDPVQDYVVFHEYKAQTWTPTTNNGRKFYDYNLLSNDMTYDATTGRSYGIFFNSDFSKQVFGYVDFNTFKRTDVATISNMAKYMAAIAAAPDGQIYTILQSSELAKINKETGQITPVGLLGVPVNTYMQSLAFDQRTGKLYWTRCSNIEHALYQIDTSTGRAYKISDFPGQEQITGIFVPDTNPLNTQAPAKITDIHLTPIEPTNTCDVQFTLPSKTVGGDDASGSMNYVVCAGPDTLQTGTGQPGESISFTGQLPTGSVRMSFLCSNSSGTSETAHRIVWGGPDVPAAPGQVDFYVDAGNVAHVKWNRVTEGLHSHHLLPSAVSYKVYRAGEKAAVATVADTVFTEDVPQQNYALSGYTITAVNNGVAGESGSSNKVAFGKAFVMPYVEGFRSKADADLFTIVNPDDDDSFWQYVSSYDRMCISCYDKADDWLITPPIHFDGEHASTLSFAARILGGRRAKLSVSVGTGDDPASYKEIVPTMSVTATSDTVYQVRIIKPEQGDYRIAWHAESDALPYSLALGNVSVKQSGPLTMPAAPTAFSAIPDAKGGTGASISLKAPDKDVKGQSLDSLSEVIVCRNDTVIHTFENPATGTTLSYKDNTPPRGRNTYSAMAILNGTRGEKASAAAFVGVDVPCAPAKLTARRTSGNNITLQWDGITTKGANGGYVDLGSIHYAVFCPDGKGMPQVIARTSQGDTTLTTTIPSFADGTIYSYVVVAYNSDTISAATESNYIVTGNSATVPYRETFPYGTLSHGWWRTGNGQNLLTLAATNASDDIAGLVFWYAANKGEDATISSTKISLAGTVNPELVFAYYVPDKSVGQNVKLHVSATKGDYLTQVTLKDIAWGDAPHTGWNTAVADLSALRDEDFIMLHFRAESNVTGNEQGLVAIDNIRIQEHQANDLSVLLSLPQDTVVAGQKAVVRVHVYNNAASAQGTGLITLRDAHDKVLGSVSLDSVPEPYGYKLYDMDYQSDIRDRQTAVVKAEVTAEYDDDADNNTSSATIGVSRPHLPTVADLEASGTSGGNLLKWKAPERQIARTTETFESAPAWSIYNIGDWRLVDGDRGNAYDMGSLNVPRAGTPYAFMVFNPVQLGINYTTQSVYVPHSGNQYLAAFSVDPSTTQLGHNDDWLISPSLSGKQQDVSFYVRMPSDEYEAEHFEVLYSCAGKDTAAFRLLADYPMVSTEWYRVSVRLPEGSRYFAIRYLSHNCMSMFIDDITYQSGTPIVQGYRIYRDGEPLTDVTSADSAFTDTDGGAHSYQVSVLYEDAESELSDAAVITGMHNVAIEQPGGAGAQAFYGVDGKLLGTRHVDASGIYLLRNKQTGRVRKQVVR